MKNKLYFIGMITIILLTFVFFSCEPQEVIIVGYDQADSVDSVAAVKTTNTGTLDNNYVILTWGAIDNGSSYNIYMRQDGKKTITSLSAASTNLGTYDATGTLNYMNLDADRWTARVQYQTAGITLDSFFGKRIQFGVAANVPGFRDQSDITWSAALQF